MIVFYNFKHKFLFNIFKSRYNKYFSTATLTNELESLVSNCHKLLEKPNLLPKHVQKLHNLAIQVRSGREFLGISQSDLCVNNQPLLKAERIIYTIYDKINPEFYFVASREPAAINFYKLYLNTINQSNSKDHRNSLSKWISKYDFDALGLYVLESINTTKISFRNIAKARLLFWRSYQFPMFITRRILGPGHPVSNPLPVPTADGPSRFYRFKLRPIRKDYWNVLCFANSEKLRKTSMELINNYLSSGKQVKYLEYTESSNYSENKNDKLLNSNESSSIEDKSTNDSLKHKTKGFWIVYSKRFKESIHLLSVSDIANILKSFHIYNKDSGEYVVAVLELQRRIKELDAKSLLDVLWVLSRRLKLNTQKQFFKSLATQVPNVLYALNGNDIVNVLWNLYNAGYTDVEICNRVYSKFMDYLDQMNEQSLSAACLAFGRYGYRNMDLYSRIEPRISKNCNEEVLFQASWGLFMAAIDVTKLISERTETLVNSLEGSPRWKVKVWKTILNSTNCDEDLKKTVDDHLKNT